MKVRGLHCLDFHTILSHNSFVHTPKRSLFLLLVLFFFLVTLPLHAETTVKIPAEYGEVIYRFNEKSQKQIFIIGISHRDALTWINGDNTSRVQAEIYKIGDWLIHNQGVELVLPEGFFKSLSAKIEGKNINTPERGNNCASIDMETLEKRLSDDKIYVNAEMILKENHALRLRQIEDEDLYRAVRNHLLKLARCKDDSADYSRLKSEVAILQEKRTVAMLQKIPPIVNDEFQQGNIKSKRAIVTVGMYHLHEIIRYLNQTRIIIRAPLSVSNPIKDYNSELTLSKESFGVLVIIPRTLASDQKTLEINGLDEIVRKCQSTPLIPH
jgi:hypothetical protein